MSPRTGCSPQMSLWRSRPSSQPPWLGKEFPNTTLGAGFPAPGSSPSLWDTPDIPSNLASRCCLLQGPPDGGSGLIHTAGHLSPQCSLNPPVSVRLLRVQITQHPRKNSLRTTWFYHFTAQDVLKSEAPGRFSHSVRHQRKTQSLSFFLLLQPQYLGFHLHFFPSGCKMAAKTSGVTAAKPFPKLLADGPSNLTGGNWITCPQPILTPRRWDQTTGRAHIPWTHQRLTPG